MWKAPDDILETTAKSFIFWCKNLFFLFYFFLHFVTVRTKNFHGGNQRIFLGHAQCGPSRTGRDQYSPTPTPSPLDISTSPPGIMWRPCIHESQAGRGKSQYCYIRGSYWWRGGITWVGGLIYWGDVISGIKRQRKYNNLGKGEHCGMSNEYLKFTVKMSIAVEFYLHN
jgi:hypothetical protein